MRNREIVLAILGGSVIIAAGLYFGLQARPEASSAPAPIRSAGRMSEPTAVAPVVLQPHAPLQVAPTTEAERRRVEEAVSAELSKLRPLLVERCWEPSAAKVREPTRIKLSWNGTIGVEGTALAYGVSQKREAFRADIEDCLRREIGQLKISPPPSTSVVVTVEFELP